MRWRTLPRKIASGLSFFAALLRFLKGLDADDVLAMEVASLGLANPEDIDAFSRTMHASPALRGMLDDRYLAPRYTKEDLRACAPGTLGAAYLAHLERHDLDLAFWPDIEPERDMDYFRVRMYQTHDLWHVLAGFDATDAGEVGIIGFNTGQADRWVEDDGAGPIQFILMLAALTLLHGAWMNPSLLRPAIRRFVDGYERGFAAQALYPVAWEELFDAPLEEVRARYGVQPPRRSEDAYAA